MMGHRQVEQAALFYEFSLERHIPADHLVRSIDRFVDLNGSGRTSPVCQPELSGKECGDCAPHFRDLLHSAVLGTRNSHSKGDR